MANFRQYTQCVDISNFDPRNPYVIAAWLGLYVTLPIGVLPALMAIGGIGNPLCLLLLAEVYFIAGVVGYCYWWLFRRLICIPDPPDHPADSAGDHLAIGTLIDILPPPPTLPDIDNDYSIGILLQCIPLRATLADVANKPPYGYLDTEQPVTRNANLTYTGNTGVDHEFPNHPELEIRSEILHCEFEGRGVFDMFLAARFALFPAVLAVFACLIPDVGWLIALILALLGIAIMGIAVAIGYLDEGDPSDVNPNIGELHRNDENHQGADTLVIKGHWVCDAGHRFDHHQLYYELHPITFCCKTSPVTLADCVGGGVILLKKRWANAIGDATSTATLENQKLPQNQWQVHPIIDGCQPVVIV